jgi:uncharacterized protein (TIGR02145 family)
MFWILLRLLKSTVMNKLKQMVGTFMILAATTLLVAQPPQAFKYKAIPRDHRGHMIINRNISMQFSVLLGSETGTPVYIERHFVRTNIIGMVDLDIGRGQEVLGSFADIDWGAGSYYLKTEVDRWGGTNFFKEGVAELLSVPYALYAGQVSGHGDMDTDPSNELISSMYLSGTWLYVIEGNQTTMVDLSGLLNFVEDADTDPTNELQVLSISNDTIFLSQGGYVKLPPLFDGDYNSLTNKPNLDIYLTEEVDGDIENEIQHLSVSQTGDTLFLSKSNWVLMPGISKGNYSGSFVDERDNETYRWVTIGNQIWMAENLRYLPSVVGPEIGSEVIPYYYVLHYEGTAVWQAYQSLKYERYGVLYNWPAAINGSSSSVFNPSNVQGVCPADWHLPSDAEWTQLIDYLGGEDIAGKKLKINNISYWYPMSQADEYGFSALPGGSRSSAGEFYDVYSGYWWSATEGSINGAWSRSVVYDGHEVTRPHASKEMGFSVRCVKDN